MHLFSFHIPCRQLICFTSNNPPLPMPGPQTEGHLRVPESREKNKKKKNPTV